MLEPLAWNLATCSFRSYHPDMGVPCATAIGTNRRFEAQHATHQVSSLAPYGVFRKLDHLPLTERITAYQARLQRHQTDLTARLNELTLRYPDHTLVLLCWCHLPDPDTGPMGCHRRWAADWFDKTYGLWVPEYGPVPREPEPPAATLFD